MKLSNTSDFGKKGDRIRKVNLLSDAGFDDPFLTEKNGATRQEFEL